MIDICDFAVGLSRQLYGRTMPSRAPRPPADGVLAAARCGRRDLGVQLPGRRLGVEHRGRAGLRRHRGLEAVRADPADGARRADPLDRVPRGEGYAPPAVHRLVLAPPRWAKPRRLTAGRRSSAPPDRPGWAREVGPRVAARFGRTLLELGGNNAAVVAPTADLDLALAGIVFAAAGTAGQRCTTLRRLIVHGRSPTSSSRGSATPTASCPSATRWTRARWSGRSIDEAAFAPCRIALEQAQAEGGSLVAGGEPPDGRRPPDASTSRRPSCACRADRRGAARRRSRPILYVLTYDDPRRGHRPAQRCPAGSLVGDLHPRPARSRTLPVGGGSDCGSPMSTSAPRAPRSAAPSAARRRPAAGGSRARIPGRPTCAG